VGAIFGYDQTDEAWSAILDDEWHTMVQFSPDICGEFDAALCLPAGSVTPGKMVTALKQLGFEKVFDARSASDLTAIEECNELIKRIKNGGMLPLITGCSPGYIKFAEDSYPDLIEHFFTGKLSPAMFRVLMNMLHSSIHPSPDDINLEKMTCVSIESCIARKYKAKESASPAMENALHDSILVLTVDELVLLFRQGGIDFTGLPETPFDTLQKQLCNGRIFDLHEQGVFTDTVQISGTEEASLSFKGNTVKMLIVHGYAKARVVLDSVRKGECDADLIKIMACPWT